WRGELQVQPGDFICNPLRLAGGGGLLLVAADRGWRGGSLRLVEGQIRTELAGGAGEAAGAGPESEGDAGVDDDEETGYCGVRAGGAGVGFYWADGRCTG